jgi:hypothetical protein
LLQLGVQLLCNAADLGRGHPPKRKKLLCSATFRIGLKLAA